MNLDLSAVNWPAVIAAAIATFLIGGVWYTVLFGKSWQRLNGYSDEKIADMRKLRPPPVFFGTMLVCYLIASVMMALIAIASGVTTFTAGALLGLLVWAVVAAVKATGHVASDKPWGAYAIDASYALIYLPLIGAIVGGWR